VSPLLPLLLLWVFLTVQGTVGVSEGHGVRKEGRGGEEGKEGRGGKEEEEGEKGRLPLSRERQRQTGAFASSHPEESSASRPPLSASRPLFPYPEKGRGRRIQRLQCLCLTPSPSGITHFPS